MPTHSQTTTDKLAAAMFTERNRVNIPRGGVEGYAKLREHVMIKTRTHMFDVAAESSIDGLLIHTIAWLENTCNGIMASLKRNICIQNNTFYP